MSGKQPATVFQFRKFIRYDPAEGSNHRFAPAGAFICGKEDHHANMIEVIHLRRFFRKTVHCHGDPAIGKQGKTGTIIEKFTLLGGNDRPFGRPCSATVGGFCDHQRRVAAVKMMHTFQKNADELSGRRKYHVRKCLIVSGIVADDIFLNHG